MSDKPNCYRCVHRRNVPGSAHSACVHPKTEKSHEQKMLAIIATMGGGIPEVRGAVELGVKANARGIANGWFAWPFNFDPTWLEECDGYEEKPNG